MSKTNSGIFSGIFIIFMMLPLLLFATDPDTPDDVIFVNTGAMHVATGGTGNVALYVPYAVKVTGGASDMVVNGQMNIGGHFYQDGTNPAFKVTNTFTTSTGTVRFTKNWSTDRLITSNNLTTINRGVSYVAFPNIAVATNDNLQLPAKMGMDAITFKRDNTFTGKLILKSDIINDGTVETPNNKVYDASLRITGSGASASLVDVGSVIIEREMSLYRSTSSGVDKLFGFATPFLDTQKSGYFAGNWVRRPVADPTTKHTRYVFGDEKDVVSNVILRSQYIYDPVETLKQGQAYLIRPRPDNFDYSGLRTSNGLTITNGSTDNQGAVYDQDKFTFNGSVYTLTSYSEQLFAENQLFSSPAITNNGATVNWLIGNSYTAPLDVKSIIDAMKASTLSFAPYIWVWPAGATTYQTHAITDGVNVTIANLNQIPAMGVFMVRVLSGSTATINNFSISKSWQRHAKISHSSGGGALNAPAAMRAKKAEYTNQVIFRVSPSDNNQIYDLAAVGLREIAQTGADNLDISKVYRTADIFQLYTLSSVNSKLSSNAVPFETKSVRLAFRPISETAEFELKASQIETLSSEGLWLEDTKTNEIVDLKLSDTYNFTSEPGDVEERFLVHFVSPSISDVNDQSALRDVLVYTQADRLIIDNLHLTDLSSQIRILDASGRLVKTALVDDYPRIGIPFSEVPGVYLMQLRGNRSVMVKYVNK